MTSEVSVIRLGTRGSPLAMAQAHMAAEALCRRHGLSAEQVQIIPVQTDGDRIQDRPLAEIGGKALWTKELDRALLAGEIDFAVHSMKDVETFICEGVMLASVLERADPRDRLIGAAKLEDLPEGAIVGTSSPRRAAQLLNLRPDVKVTSLRGNVHTRLQAIAEGRVHATFLAAAGLDRLQVEAGTALPLMDWLPAAAQGIVGMTCRIGDERMAKMLADICHQRSFTTLKAERAVLEGLGGSCHTPVAVHCLAGEMLEIHGELFTLDGREKVKDSVSTNGDPHEAGLLLAARLKSKASAAILESLASSK